MPLRALKILGHRDGHYARRRLCRIDRCYSRPHVAPWPGFISPYPGQGEIEIPRGARVEAMTTAPDRLILDLVLPDGNRQIVFIDLATGARVGEIELHSAP